jgi:hypothetical protein
MRVANLKVFHFTFDGLWLGGNASVIAVDATVARQLLEARMKEDRELQRLGEKDQNLELVSEIPLQMQVVSYDNGSY